MRDLGLRDELHLAQKARLNRIDVVGIPVEFHLCAGLKVGNCSANDTESDRL